MVKSNTRFLKVYAHLFGEAASIGRARQNVNGQFGKLPADGQPTRGSARQMPVDPTNLKRT